MTNPIDDKKKEILWSFPQGESEPYGHVPVKRIYEAMDKYYNQAIDDAVNAINEVRKIGSDAAADASLVLTIAKLVILKK